MSNEPKQINILEDEPLTDEAKLLREQWRQSYSEMQYWERFRGDFKGVMNSALDNVIEPNLRKASMEAAHLEARFQVAQEAAIAQSQKAEGEEEDEGNGSEGDKQMEAFEAELLKARSNPVGGRLERA